MTDQLSNIPRSPCRWRPLQGLSSWPTSSRKAWHHPSRSSRLPRVFAALAANQSTSLCPRSVFLEPVVGVVGR